MNISLALRRRRIQLLRSYMSTSKTKQKTLSPHCQIPHVLDVVQKFTSWTLDDTPRAMGKWEVTKIYIQEALTKRIREFIAEWEEREQVFSGARGSLI